ncbi:ribonuclease III domain-containing protein [Mycoplasmatota bacterium zrk1]
MKVCKKTQSLKIMLEERFSIVFKDLELLELSMTHSSYGNDNFIGNNERLEFLGDGILKASIRDWLYVSFPNEREGKLTKALIEYENNEFLIKPANDINLVEYILLGKSFKNEEDTTASYVSDAFEALIGAIYLDQGFTSARKFVEEVILIDFDINKDTDYISSINRYAQQHYTELDFVLVDEISGGHENTFYFKAQILNYVGYGVDSSKAKAKQKAAKEIYCRLTELGHLDQNKSNINYKGIINDYYYDIYGEKVQVYKCKNLLDDKVQVYKCKNLLDDKVECELHIKGEVLSKGYGPNEKLSKIEAAKKGCEILKLI